MRGSKSEGSETEVDRSVDVSQPLEKLHDRHWTAERGIFSSVMEYPVVNIAGPESPKREDRPIAALSGRRRPRDLEALSTRL